MCRFKNGPRYKIWLYSDFSDYLHYLYEMPISEPHQSAIWLYKSKVMATVWPKQVNNSV